VTRLDRIQNYEIPASLIGTNRNVQHIINTGEIRHSAMNCSQFPYKNTVLQLKQMKIPPEAQKRRESRSEPTLRHFLAC